MRIIRNTAIIASLFLGATACEDLKFGGSFLEKPAGSEMTIDSVFATKQYADQALRQVYRSLPDFLPSEEGYNHGALIHDVFSDIAYTTLLSWNHGSINASSGYHSFPYHLGVESDKQEEKEMVGDPTYGIRKAYIYIENVDKVKDMTDDEKAIRKAEAKVIIATHYIMMFRFYGGLPWIDHAYTAEDKVFDMPRMTVEETVNKISTLLDDAAKVLPWYTSDEEYGHMTAAAAKALKFRLLMFAASPLFNNEKPYFDGEAAEQKLTWYGNYSDERWEAALAAGQEFIELNNANNNHYEIFEGGKDKRDNYLQGYWKKGNPEVIMATFRWPTYIDGNKAFRMYDQGYGSPRGNYADLFQWSADGSDFDWDKPEHKEAPFFDAKGRPTRDPRMYETLLVNGDTYKGRKAQVYVGGSEGTGTNTTIGVMTQYGYGFRKFIQDRKVIYGQPYSCPFIRMPEIYLGLAEAMNRLGKAESTDKFGNTAYDYLNKVRKRVGMKGETSSTVAPGDKLTEYLLDERAREFGQEDMRYFDMIRCRKGAEWATRPMEMLTTTMVGDKFEYTVTTDPNIKYLWDDKWYLVPFPTVEINKKYGLVQNPGW